MIKDLPISLKNPSIPPTQQDRHFNYVTFYTRQDSGYSRFRSEGSGRPSIILSAKKISAAIQSSAQLFLDLIKEDPQLVKAISDSPITEASAWKLLKKDIGKEFDRSILELLIP